MKITEHSKKRKRNFKESNNIFDAGWKFFDGNILTNDNKVQDTYNYMISVLGIPDFYRVTTYDHEFLYNKASTSQKYNNLKNYDKRIGIGEINYDNVDDSIRKFITIPR